ncbi:DnaT-like ssDNA-binding protein [Pseudomonas qingdaonensis]|uniref:DnaT-like ssDNA-binding protein n=1 Tax=Pseudomonas qingdaonensis TaxID=2056231 RepID=UPI0036BAB131
MADYYGTVAGADAYHQARGNAAWAAATEADKEAALARASAYIDGLGTQLPTTGCILSFPGRKVGGRAQARQWPRDGATDRNGDPIDAGSVPREVEQAVYEGALRELVKPGSLNPDYVASKAVKRAKVGPLETEFFGPEDGEAQPNKPVIGIINDILAPIMVLRCPLPAVVVV